MKAFIAAIIVLIVLAFTLTDLPQDLVQRLQHSAGISRFFQERLIIPLAKNFAGGKNPQELRLGLIDEIEGSLGALQTALQKNQTPKSGTGRTATTTENAKNSPAELVAQAQDLLEELKSHNADEGFLRHAADKIITKALPQSNTCAAK